MEKENLSIEDIRKTVREEVGKTITESLDSALIFKYINDLEKDLAVKKDAENYIDRLIDKVVNEGATYDLLAVLCTLQSILKTQPDYII